MKNKMIKFGVLALALFASVGASAQKFLSDPRYGADEETRKKCALNLSLYQDGFKSKDYKSAYKYWKVAHDICPGASLAALQRGRAIYVSFIDEAKDEATKQAYVDTLLSLYDVRAKYYPKKEAEATEYKIKDMLTYRPDQLPQALTIINKLLDQQGDNANAEIIAYGMLITTQLYQKQEATAEDVMNYYGTKGSIVEKQLAADPNNEEIKKAKETLDAYFINSGVANCDNLVELYTPRFEKTPNDVDLLKKIVSLLGANRCNKSDLYFKAAVQLQAVDPTPEGALNLAKLYVERGEYTKSVPLFKEAAAAQGTGEDKANIFLLAADAALKGGAKGEAKSFAKLALEANPNSGLAYIVLANVVGSERCGGANPVISAGPYFVAVDYLRKAKQVDPSVASDADRLINSYSAGFPSKTDLFSYAYEEGQTITVGCGINERTTIRSK